MGTTEEKGSEPAALPQSKDQGLIEKEPAVETPQTSETSDPLNTYKWHTKGAGSDLKEEGDGDAASSTPATEKYQKAASNKWAKMQNWRKALSEDTAADKSSSGGKSADGAKPEKGAARKNPFRRAVSEPAGSLFAALSSSTQAASSSSSSSSAAAAAASSEASCADPSQKGSGGALFKKYLWNVTQKLKRPKLQTRSSTPTLLPGNSFNLLLRAGFTGQLRVFTINLHETVQFLRLNCHFLFSQVRMFNRIWCRAGVSDSIAPKSKT